MSGALLQAASASERITIQDDTFALITLSDPATSGYRLESDGDIIHFKTSGNTDEGDWIAPKGSAPGDYQVRATLNSGSLTAGSSATGSWLALSTTRTWSVQQSGVGTSTAQITVEIRRGTGAVLASAVIDLSAQVTI